MSSPVNLRELAVDREPTLQLVSRGPRRHLLTRYVVPAALAVGFASVLAWSLRESLLPRRPVTVMPIHASRAAVQRSGSPLFKAAGWIEPRPTPIRVAAVAPGVVDELLVVEDQAVEVGQPIARLVAADARLGVASARAELDLREAEQRRAVAARTAARTNYDRPTHLQSALAEAEALRAQTETALANLPFEIRRAESRLELAERSLEGKTLAAEAISALARTTAKSERDSALALLDELRRRLPRLEAERDARVRFQSALTQGLELRTDEKRALDEAEAALGAAQAEVDRAGARLDEAELRLKRMTIVAPVTGRILHLHSAPGARLSNEMGVTTGRDGSTIVTMYEPDKLQVRADVRFENLPQVGFGQPVQIESPALAAPLTGRVLFLTSAANIQKNTLEVKVALDDAPSVLKPEMLVDATFLEPDRPADATPSEELRLYLPRPLVLSDDQGSFVWIAETSAGLARRNRVTLGRDVGPLVEVVSGLTLGSRLIVGGREGLTDGERIEITGEDESLGGESMHTAGLSQSHAGHAP